MHTTSDLETGTTPPRLPIWAGLYLFPDTSELGDAWRDYATRTPPWFPRTGPVVDRPGPQNKSNRLMAFVVRMPALLLLLVGCASPAAAAVELREIQVPPPPFSEGIFPCSGCHSDLPVNRQRRKLTEMHAEIVLNHGPESRWCLDCHAAEDRDTLHLASGEAVPFTASYLLCGQCHGEKLRDWKVGVHGKRTGDWNGRKQYLLCAHCHDPHSPRFKPLKPLPPPVRPEQIRPARGDAR